MGISQKVLTGKSTPQGKPTVKKGPSQKAALVTPKRKGDLGKCG